MFYGLKEGSVDIPSGKLCYITFGKGNKNLILIQGLNVRDAKGAGVSLAYMYRIFAEEYRVFIFDRRTVVKNGLSIWDLSEDIYDAMQALNVATAAVFGVSQGGMIAIALTLEHPECVEKLVLCVTTSRINDTLRQNIDRWVSCAQRKDCVTINKDTFSLMYSEKYLKKYSFFLPFAIRLVKPKDFNRFAILASSMLDFDCFERIKEIRCPVLVLGAGGDKIVTGAASAEIAEKLNCEIYMYCEYGHAVYDEAEDFNSRVYAFLTK